MTNIERGLRRIVWIISALGLLVALFALVAALYFYASRSQAVRPFIESLNQWEQIVNKEKPSLGDAEKGRAYLAYQFVTQRLGKRDAAVPSGSQDDSANSITRYVYNTLENDYPVWQAFGVALLGIVWFVAIWLAFVIIRWIFRGFQKA
jgi:hypothetical protein